MKVDIEVWSPAAGENEIAFNLWSCMKAREDEGGSVGKDLYAYVAKMYSNIIPGLH
jgi:hypothetical protein